jgi:N-acetylmuramoyl-L-alanine amidase
MRPITKLILHCSASPDNMDIGVKEITEWHIERGFKTIGYHYVIRRGGLVQRGRQDEEIGAHCKGHNTTSIGICLVGQDKYTPEQGQALHSLFTLLWGRYPKAKAYGHYELDSGKTCPNLAMPKVRDALINSTEDLLKELKSQGRLTE